MANDEPIFYWSIEESGRNLPLICKVLTGREGGASEAGVAGLAGRSQGAGPEGGPEGGTRGELWELLRKVSVTDS